MLTLHHPKGFQVLKLFLPFFSAGSNEASAIVVSADAASLDPVPLTTC
jgi:hypothetical protein